MMRDLARMDCVPCRGGVPILSEIEVRELQPLIPEWRVTEVEGVQHLERVFKFKNFAQALEFTNKVGEITETAGHHPAILTEWGKVTISWWTHAIQGLHRNDFIMAARTDEIIE